MLTHSCALRFMAAVSGRQVSRDTTEHTEAVKAQALRENWIHTRWVGKWCNSSSRSLGSHTSQSQTSELTSYQTWFCSSWVIAVYEKCRLHEKCRSQKCAQDTTGFHRANTKKGKLRTNDSTSSNKIQGEKWGLWLKQKQRYVDIAWTTKTNHYTVWKTWTHCRKLGSVLIHCTVVMFARSY